MSELATVGTPFDSKCTSFPRNSGPKKAITKILVNAVQTVPKRIKKNDFFADCGEDDRAGAELRRGGEGGGRGMIRDPLHRRRCGTEGCENIAQRRGYCNRCYRLLCAGGRQPERLPSTMGGGRRGPNWTAEEMDLLAGQYGKMSDISLARSPLSRRRR